MKPDILILGAGLAGTSLAWHLAGRARVRVLEQGPQPCAEASAQNAGMIRRLVPSARERAWACRTHERLAERLPDWADADPFRRTGSLIALGDADSSEAHALEAAAIGLRERGVGVERVGGAELVRHAPAFAGSAVAHGYWIEDDGVCDPHALGAGFVRGALRRGVRFDFDTRVDRILTVGDRVVGVEAGGETIHAGHVVVATAAWTPRLVAPLGIERPLLPFARHLFFSEPHALATQEHPWCWIDDAGVYVRPETGAFLCSPCDETLVEVSPGPGSRRAVQPLGRAIAHDKLERWLPALRDLRLHQGWVGIRTFTPSREALVGPDQDLAGLFWMTAFGGFGVSCAFGAGETAADRLTGTRAEHPIDECSADA
ncbi:MAG: FAD-binding oxidoreductase [Planctomycetes bacterium]|nr:FAD-binding oxidoreductase [Planctomycetota bacterium]